jgi:hypothetical protein
VASESLSSARVLIVHDSLEELPVRLLFGWGGGSATRFGELPACVVHTQRAENQFLLEHCGRLTCGAGECFTEQDHSDIAVPHTLAGFALQFGGRGQRDDFAIRRRGLVERSPSWQPGAVGQEMLEGNLVAASTREFRHVAADRVREGNPLLAGKTQRYSRCRTHLGE